MWNSLIYSLQYCYVLKASCNECKITFKKARQWNTESTASPHIYKVSTLKEFYFQKIDIFANDELAKTKIWQTVLSVNGPSIINIHKIQI